MSSAATVQDLNRKLAREINQEARNNPQSAYANKFVGIANGKVAAVSDNLNDLAQQLRRIESDPLKCFCVEASRDYTVVEEIWGAL